jgi:mannosyltransferase OCH1-like enzyme
MIPKIIHYIWLGKKPKNLLIQKCMASWMRIMPDWRIQCWNEDNLSLDHPYVKLATHKQQYAFASDYLRIHILYLYGGVYLDVDMELVKPLEGFLQNDAFAGYQSTGIINAGILGSHPDNKYLKRVLAEYDDVAARGNLEIICDILTRCYRQCRDSVTVYDSRYFYPYNPYDINPLRNGQSFMLSDVSDDTYAIHHWNKSWLL